MWPFFPQWPKFTMNFEENYNITIIKYKSTSKLHFASLEYNLQPKFGWNYNLQNNQTPLKKGGVSKIKLKWRWNKNLSFYSFTQNCPSNTLIFCSSQKKVCHYMVDWQFSVKLNFNNAQQVSLIFLWCCCILESIFYVKSTHLFFFIKIIMSLYDWQTNVCLIKIINNGFYWSIISS